MITFTDGKITDNFLLSEVVCPDGSAIPQSLEYERFKIMLQEFREWYNRPISPNSWYRSPSHNASKEVGGSPQSQHLNAIAIDFSYPKEYYDFSVMRQRQFILNCRNKWKEINIKYGTTGAFYYYDRHMHIDSRADDYFKYGYIKY